MVKATVISDPKFNVKVTNFVLQSNPARIIINVEIAGQTFFSEITYHTIQSWGDLWNKCRYERKSLILGSLVAWDCMRFMALGGEALELCDGLYVDKQVQDAWNHCFLKQFGEWRYRNNFRYRTAEFPRVINSNPMAQTFSIAECPSKSHHVDNHWLLTNGGGKDSLVGMLLMQDSDLSFDIYEGCLPIGGASDIQSSLLNKLRNAVDADSELVNVTVEDDFFLAGNEIFEIMGLAARHYKSDFAVGHTANYLGYFPLILNHGYTGVLFNIEKSADRSMVNWNGENINHQWCKSIEYQQICTQLFAHITGLDWFQGFSSTLRGLYDSLIYAIAATEEDLLRKTHSCNIDKPWCRKCPKCCFSYLMLSAFKDEKFALEVVGGAQSLFDMLENANHWRDLLDVDYVAWECVPSHEECLLAVNVCLQKGISHEILVRYAEQAVNAARISGSEYAKVDWLNVPDELIRATIARIEKTRMPIECDVVIVGAGQSGLSMSYALMQNGINHIVIEADSIGASWKNRWDTFQLNTPNRTLTLNGKQYEGNDPDGFSTKEDVIKLLGDYAKQFKLPVIDNNRVLSVDHQDDKYTVKTEIATIIARAVVVATGEYSTPRKPRINGGFDSSVNQGHSRDYKNAQSLPVGAVLVVGGGQSGAQITEDMHASGRTVYFSISDRPSNMRRIYGKDFMEWWDIGGILHRHVDDDPDVRARKPGALYKARTTEFPLVSGNGSCGVGHSISLQVLSESGVVLLGKLQSVIDGVAQFNQIGTQIERAVAGTRAEYEKLSGFAKEYYRENGLATIEEGDFIPSEIVNEWCPSDAPTQIDLKNANITNVIYATGYSSEWPWLNIPNVTDEFSYPLGHDGVSPVDGLFFIGMFNLQRLSSTCLCNQGRDAATLLPHIIEHLHKKA